jgi:hypothetical protein
MEYHYLTLPSAILKVRPMASSACLDGERCQEPFHARGVREDRAEMEKMKRVGSLLDFVFSLSSPTRAR